MTILTVGSALASETGGISVFIIVVLGVGGRVRGSLVRLFHLFQDPIWDEFPAAYLGIRKLAGAAPTSD